MEQRLRQANLDPCPWGIKTFAQSTANLLGNPGKTRQSPAFFDRAESDSCTFEDQPVFRGPGPTPAASRKAPVGFESGSKALSSLERSKRVWVVKPVSAAPLIL
ncbi:unnamed protein product [Caretta caretta]